MSQEVSTIRYRRKYQLWSPLWSQNSNVDEIQDEPHISSQKYASTYSRKSLKRRKIGDEEEAIIKWEDETKIRIDQHALENYNELLSDKGNHEITGVHDYGNEIRPNSDIDTILKKSENILLEGPNKHYGFYTPDGIDHQESINELMSSKEKVEDFTLIQPDSQMEENMQLLPNNIDWKLESLQFTETKQPKLQEELGLEMNDEVSLQLDHNPDSLMEAFLPN